MNNCFWYYLFSLVHVVFGSYENRYLIQLPQPNRKSTSKCDNGSITALVERFFRVIFYEFNNDPPVCVCVQMCVDQPTYCYPNGCLRNREVTRKAPDHQFVDWAEVEGTIHEKKEDKENPLLLLLNEKDIHSDSHRKYLQDTFQSEFDLDSTSSKQKPPLKDIRPNLFKDRYKKLFKYAKIPKVELRYRLNEQIKNMQSDKQRMNLKIPNVAPASDLPKTTWRRYGRGEPSMPSQVKPLTSLNGKLMAFEKKFDEINMINKRDVTKTNSEDNIIITPSLQLIPRLLELENVTFSLEKIISEMIETDMKNTISNIPKLHKTDEIQEIPLMGNSNDTTFKLTTNVKKKITQVNPRDKNKKSFNLKNKRQSVVTKEEKNSSDISKNNTKILDNVYITSKNKSTSEYGLSSNLTSNSVN